MKNPKKFLRVALLLLAIPLAGAKAEDIVGCGGCGGGGGGDESSDGTTTDPTGDIPGGGGVAASKTYSMDRSQMGTTTETLTSKGYKVSGTLGASFSQGRVLSDKYLIHHPLSRNVITDTSDTSGLVLEKDQKKETGEEPEKDQEPPPE